MKETRLLDANINRSAEGLRVLEDIARFTFDNQKISADIRRMRHRIRNLFKGRENVLLESRDAGSDVGTATSQNQSADRRISLKDSALSNFKRVQEALRSIEEILKSKGEYSAGKSAEKLRFDVYETEPAFLRLFSPALPQGIYGILGEKFSRGKTNIRVAKEMVGAGIDILQYREKEKDKSLKQMHEECLEIRKITRDEGVPFIVNDFVDIALMVEADGVHQGQDDLPIDRVKQIAPGMMVGCSTHSPDQAAQAVRDGADYIGVGPIFTTQTKEDVCDAVGFEYLEYVVEHHTIPFVAIGGIKRSNLREVVRRGARTVCLVTEIIGAQDIDKRIREIRNILGEIQ